MKLYKHIAISLLLVAAVMAYGFLVDWVLYVE